MASMDKLSLEQLRTEDVLQDERIDCNETKRIYEDVVDSIRELLVNMPDQKVPAASLEAFVGDLGAPADKVDLAFRKPESVKIIGSYAHRALTKPFRNVDVAVRIPKACFYRKDFQDFRFHAKRALYLDAIRRYLLKSSCPSVRRIAWAALCHDATKPILVVEAAGRDDNGRKQNFQIRIIPTVSCDVFELVKLVPGRCNVRNKAKPLEGQGQPTPHYSSTILEDMFMEEHDMFVRKHISESKNILDALLLLKVWARNRHSICSPDCLNGFLISLIVASLSTGAAGSGGITSGMSAIEIFRVVMNFLAASPRLQKGIFMDTQSGSFSLDGEHKKAFKQSFDVVICDAGACFNFAFRMSKAGLQELRDEAARTLQHMINYGDESFEEIFRISVDIPAKFDYCVRISPPEDQDGEWRAYEKKVEEILVKGLSDRAALVRVIPRSIPADWCLDVKGLGSLNCIPLVAGIMISNFEKGFRFIDIGPSADKKDEALKFRQFWGERSELRRFKDGVIAECSVWDCGYWEKHLIIKKIIECVLGHHLKFSSPSCSISVIAGELDFTLMQEREDAIAYTSGLLTAFGDLAKRLRSLQELPLQISSVQPLDAAFRQTSVFYPKPHPLATGKQTSHWSRKPLPTCIPSMEVMIQLEGSGNWPIDELLVEKTKASFCVMIARCMAKQFDVSAVASDDTVDLLMSGYAFRLRICYEKDKSLLKKSDTIGLPGLQSKVKVPLDKDLLLRSQHASMINGLQGRYPIYSPTVRLAKRWFSSHLFSGVLYDEAIELLVAYLFVKPFPFQAPCSRITGFLRFLRLLADYQWACLPLIVDINGDLTSKEHHKILQQFSEKKEKAKEEGSTIPAMYIATSYDTECESWTALSPDTNSLKRLVAYARSSARLLTQLISNALPTGWESLFFTPLHCYDAMLTVYTDKLPYPSNILFKTNFEPESEPLARSNASKNFNAFLPVKSIENGFGAARNNLMVGFDPLKHFLDDINSSEFSECFDIWYNGMGSEVIGLTWRGGASLKRKRGDAEPPKNVKKYLREIVNIGDGFVKGVYLLNT